MNHVITVGNILVISAGLVGLVATCMGLLMVFAGGMSDAPEEGASTSSAGCAVTIVGGTLIAISIWIFA